MKQLNLFLASVIISCFLFSCESDDEVRPDTLQDNTEIPVDSVDSQKTDSIAVDSVDSQETDSIDEVIGSWYLSERDGGFNIPMTFSPGKIIYRFYDDGLLSVQDSTKHAVFLSSGSHNYTLDKEKGEITIDRSRYWYYFKNNQLIIDTGSAWDGFFYKFCPLLPEP